MQDKEAQVGMISEVMQYSEAKADRDQKMWKKVKQRLAEIRG